MADFKGERYMTKGVNREVDFILQLVMWGVIDEHIQAGEPMDYLQVFRLSKVVEEGQEMQELVYSQEVPPREKRMVFPTDSVITQKIYVIDDGQYVTMLLAEEY